MNVNIMKMAEENLLLTQAEFKQLPCDAWHVHGNSSRHANVEEDEFVKTLQERIPQIDLPVEIGPTGYPQLTRQVAECPKRGWCYDNAKRFTAIVDGHLLFRRYTAGGPLMFGPLGLPANNIMCEDDKVKILKGVLTS